MSEKTVKGNLEKYQSYEEVWRRIKSAQESGFYLEAIAIKESIMPDRITSYSSHRGLLTKNKRPSFHELVAQLNWHGMARRDPSETKKSYELNGPG